MLIENIENSMHKRLVFCDVSKTHVKKTLTAYGPNPPPKLCFSTSRAVVFRFGDGLVVTSVGTFGARLLGRRGGGDLRIGGTGPCRDRGGEYGACGTETYCSLLFGTGTRRGGGCVDEEGCPDMTLLMRGC